MNLTYRSYFAADTYNADAYGTGTYQEVQGTSTGSDAGSPLANTGYDVLVPASLGLAIVAASIVLLVKRFRAKKQF